MSFFHQKKAHSINIFIVLIKSFLKLVYFNQSKIAEKIIAGLGGNKKFGEEWRAQTDSKKNPGGKNHRRYFAVAAQNLKVFTARYQFMGIGGPALKGWPN
jgi:hypothetical protein